MRKWILLIALLVTRAEAYYPESGNELLEMCLSMGDALNRTFDTNNIKSSQLQALEVGFCTGYISGIHQIHDTFVHWNKMKPRWCIPDGVLLGQLEGVVVKHLKEYPQNLHLTASSLTAGAITEAFPCE